MPSIASIADMCSHIHNATRGSLGITSIKNTKYNLALAIALHRCGFLSAVCRAGPHPPTMEQMLSQTPEPVTTANVAKMRIWLGLKYWDGKPVLSHIQNISKSSRFVTADVNELGRLTRGLPTQLKGGVLPGLDLGECMFVSTSRGTLEAREALSYRVGGLLLCRAS